LSLIQNASYPPSLVRQMKTEGAVVLTQLFSEQALSALEDAARSLTVPPDEMRKRSFERLAYGDGAPAKIIEDLCADPDFVRLIEDLAGPHQVVTNLLWFELTPGKKGEDWHFGRRSFCFVPPDVPAFTLWIPLTPVRERENGGGLVWLPQDALSAYSTIQQWTYVFRELGEGRTHIPMLMAQKKQFGSEGDPWAGPLEYEMFESGKIEADFDPGDALFFSRNVWHRTSPLKRADLPNRKAVVIRFADGRALLDQKTTAGLVSSLRPEADTFLKMLLACDGATPIALQPFATPVGSLQAVSTVL
jgi:Phytanoyl-CoA dioxygenase (PhyH)